MAKIGFQAIEAPEYAEGQRRSKALLRRNLVDHYLLRLNGTFNVTGGSGAGTIFSDAAFRIWEQIIIKAGGHEMQNWRGRTLGRYLRMFDREELVQDVLSTDAASTSEAVESNVKIPFTLLDSDIEAQLGFPTYDIDAPQIILDHADLGETINGEDATGLALASAAYTLYERPRLGVPLQPARQLYGAVIVNYTVEDIAGAATNRKITLDHLQPGDEVARVLVEAENNGSSGSDYEDSDTLVTSCGFNVNGIDEHEKAPWNVLRNANKAARMLAARESGAVVFDATEDNGKAGPGELWEVAHGQKPYVILDNIAPTNDARVVVTTVSVRRFRGR